MTDGGSRTERPVVLAMGGLDPSGGAGVLQDAWCIRSQGVHPIVVLTAVAIQNTSRFVKNHLLDAGLIRKQLETLSEEFRLGAVKVGMLGSPAAVEAVGSWLADRPRLPLVMDPVLSSSSGGSLAAAGTEAALKSVLLPRATVVTPNLSEASILSGISVSTAEGVPRAARVIQEHGAGWVLITGGHLSGREAGRDFLLGPDTESWLEGSHDPGKDYRGTGCALASTLAARLALGHSVSEAAHTAKQFVTRAVHHGYLAGAGHFLDSGKGPS